MSTQIEEEVELGLEAILDAKREIVLFDDDYNTFDHVIESLVNICNHSAVQAEQCTMIVHYNGKCSVKKGEKEKLSPLCRALVSRGLTAKIV